MRRSIWLGFLLAVACGESAPELPDAAVDGAIPHLEVSVVDLQGTDHVVVVHDEAGAVLDSAAFTGSALIPDIPATGVAAVTLATHTGESDRGPVWHLTTLWDVAPGDEITFEVPGLTRNLTVRVPGLQGAWEYLVFSGEGCTRYGKNATLAAPAPLDISVSADSRCADRERRLTLQVLAHSATEGDRTIWSGGVDLASSAPLVVDLSDRSWSSTPQVSTIAVTRPPGDTFLDAKLYARRGGVLVAPFATRSPQPGTFEAQHAAGLAEGYRLLTITANPQSRVEVFEDVTVVPSTASFDLVRRYHPVVEEMSAADSPRPAFTLGFAPDTTGVDGVILRTSVNSYTEWTFLFSPRRALVVPALPETVAAARPTIANPMYLRSIEVISGDAFTDPAELRAHAGVIPVPARGRFVIESR